LEGDFAALTDSLDIALCLLLFADVHWLEVFKKKLSIDHRTWAKELSSFRNKSAHIGGKDFTDDDTWRALDTMSRLSEQINPDGAEEIRGLLRKSRYGTESGSTTVTEASTATAATKSKNAGILNTTPINGLPSWREICCFFIWKLWY